MQPGKYIAFAAGENGVDLWNNNEFVKLLESEDTDLNLHENERATVRLKLITKNETDRIRKQLGL
jgi:hypothetical protein